MQLDGLKIIRLGIAEERINKLGDRSIKTN